MRLGDYPVRITKKYEENGIPVSLFGADYYLVPIEEEIEDWKEFEEIEGRILEELSSLKVCFVEPYLNEFIYKLRLFDFQEEEGYFCQKIDTKYEGGEKGGMERVYEELMILGMAMYPFTTEFIFWTKDKITVDNPSGRSVKFVIFYPYAHLIPESSEWVKRFVKYFEERKSNYHLCHLPHYGEDIIIEWEDFISQEDRALFNSFEKLYFEFRQGRKDALYVDTLRFYLKGLYHFVRDKLRANINKCPVCGKVFDIKELKEEPAVEGINEEKLTKDFFLSKLNDKMKFIIFPCGHKSPKSEIICPICLKSSYKVVVNDEEGVILECQHKINLFNAFRHMVVRLKSEFDIQDEEIGIF